VVLGDTMAELFGLKVKRDDASSNRHPALGYL
jgi:hypothetical protein